MDKKAKIKTSILILLFTSVFIFSSSGIKASNETPLKNFGFSGMEIKEINIENKDIGKSIIEPGKSELINLQPIEFNKLNIFEEKKLRNKVKHTINLKDLDFISTQLNYSTVIKIDYNEIIWNGTKYKLTSKPIKLTSWYEEGELRVPNIFMDDIHNKRINYKDVAEQGGYALAYNDGTNNIIELRIDNFKLSDLNNYIIDPEYYNATDGFFIGVAGAVGADAPAGITIDRTDTTLWIGDYTYGFIFHTDLSGNNITDGWAWAHDYPKGMAFDTSDNTLWILDTGTEYMYHYNTAGADQGGSFDLNPLGWSSPQGVAYDSTDDTLWITDGSKSCIGHVSTAGSNLSGSMSDSYLADARGITYDTDTDTLWVVSDTIMSVAHYGTNGTNMSDAFEIGSSGIGFPLGIAYDYRDTSFWICDKTDEFVYHFTLTEEEVPSNVFMHVNDVEVWNYSGDFETTETTDDFSQQLNDALNTCTADSEGYCDISIILHSDSAGKINISNINIYFNITDYTWDTTDLANLSTYKVRVKSTDGYLNSSWDESDSNFTIGEAPPQDTHKFYIKNSGGDKVAWFGDLGNIVLAGTCTASADCNAPPDSFIFKGTNYDTVAYIDSNGNLCIQDSNCDDNDNSCEVTRTPDSFIIKDGNDVVAYINKTGGLCLEGSLTQSGSP